MNTKTGGPNGSIRNEEEYSHGSNNGLKIALDFCGEPFLLALFINFFIKLNMYVYLFMYPKSCTREYRKVENR